MSSPTMQPSDHMSMACVLRGCASGLTLLDGVVTEGFALEACDASWSTGINE